MRPGRTRAEGAERRSCVDVYRERWLGVSPMSGGDIRGTFEIVPRATNLIQVVKKHGTSVRVRTQLVRF